MRYVGVIITAVSIDVFQGLFTLSFWALSFVGIPISAIPLVGQAAAGAIGAAGIAIGAAVTFAISATFGVGFISLLIFSGLLSLRRLFSLRYLPFALGEFAPVVGALPCYTGLAVMCIRRDMEKRRAAGASISARLVRGLVGRKAASASVQEEPRQQEPEQRGYQSAEPGGAASPQKESPIRLRPTLGDIRPRTPLKAADDTLVQKTYGAAA